MENVNEVEKTEGAESLAFVVIVVCAFEGAVAVAFPHEPEILIHIPVK